MDAVEAVNSAVHTVLFSLLVIIGVVPCADGGAADSTVTRILNLLRETTHGNRTRAH